MNILPNKESSITFQTGLYSCEITQSITITGAIFGISVPPGDMLAIAEFALTHRARLEQQQRILDQEHETLVQEVKTYCALYGKDFNMLSSWDLTDLMREVAGTTGPIDEWQPVEQLSEAGRWYRTICCDETGGIYSHIWEPFYAVVQRHQEKTAIGEKQEGSQSLQAIVTL